MTESGPSVGWHSRAEKKGRCAAQRASHYDVADLTASVILILPKIGMALFKRTAGLSQNAAFAWVAECRIKYRAQHEIRLKTLH